MQNFLVGKATKYVSEKLETEVSIRRIKIGVLGSLRVDGFYVEDYSDLEQGAREIAHIDLIDEELIKKDRDTAIIHIYIEPTEN
ncbi:MAG: hypothetical protein U0L21_03225, partial [Alistipes sp.]|nr:hypothetical protein [Alistipes sp.]